MGYTQIIRGHRDGGNSVEHDEMLIKPVLALNYISHQIWAQSDLHFFQELRKIAQPIRDQEMAEIQGIVAKNSS